MNNIKIYLKESDKARLANVRIRIVRENSPRQPDKNEDLVFVKVDNESDIPENSIYHWHLNLCNDICYFYTTADRCKQMVSDDPSYWTEEKLKKLAEIERQIWHDWYVGDVYGFVREKWNAKQRKWETISSLWGMYGSDELIENLKDELYNENDILVCLDDEDMKYNFNDVEMKLNEFD